jgi:hypothetical protein
MGYCVSARLLAYGRFAEQAWLCCTPPSGLIFRANYMLLQRTGRIRGECAFLCFVPLPPATTFGRSRRTNRCRTSSDRVEHGISPHHPTEKAGSNVPHGSSVHQLLRCQKHCSQYLYDMRSTAFLSHQTLSDRCALIKSPLLYDYEMLTTTMS